MKGRRISLTNWQTEMLKPLFDQAKSKFDDGDPVGIFAQVFGGHNDRTKPGFLDVRLIDGDVCKAMQNVTGAPKDLPDGKTRFVYVLEPNDH